MKNPFRRKQSRRTWQAPRNGTVHASACIGAVLAFAYHATARRDPERAEEFRRDVFEVFGKLKEGGAV